MSMDWDKKNSSGSRKLLEEFKLSIIGGVIAGCIMSLYMEIVKLLIH